MGFSAATRALVQGSIARDHGSIFRRTAVVHVGGLRTVGAVPGTERWLVVSANGRGLFDVNGERLGRDETPWSSGSTAEAIGPHAGTSVTMAGLGAGTLPLRTEDGWQLAFDPRAGLWLAPPSSSLDGPLIEVLRVPVHGEPRVLGFSSAGGSFVVADAATLAIFAR